MDGKKSRTALITGGTRGIGLAIAHALKADGAKVVAIYHGDDAAAQHFEKETGGYAFKLDVAHYDACESVTGQIEKQVGPIDILVNNAGITRDFMLHKMPAESWYDVIATNLSSCYNTCRFIVPGMRERGWGRVINISSINGQKGQLGQTNYSAAKAGMIGFTKALALECAARGITVNAICPGYIETEMTAAMKQDVLESIIRQIPMGRMGQPWEIAALAAFLASDDAAFITGATYSANGGQYMV